VNAEDIDRAVFREIIQVLTNPSSLVEAWLKDQNIETIKGQVKRLQQKEKVAKNKLTKAFALITSTDSEEIKRIYEEERQKYEKEFKEISASLKQAERENDLIFNKVDRLAEFQKAVDRATRTGKANIRTKAGVGLKKFLHTFPFNEKKRIVEAVISPETGGKILINYPTWADALSPDERTGVPKAELDKPLDKPEIYMDFQIDLARLESLINGLDKKGLSNKFNSGRVSGRAKDAHRWRRFPGRSL
jgi:hypothetical protein